MPIWLSDGKGPYPRPDEGDPTQGQLIKTRLGTSGERGVQRARGTSEAERFVQDSLLVGFFCQQGSESKDIVEIVHEAGLYVGGARCACHRVSTLLIQALREEARFPSGLNWIRAPKSIPEQMHAGP